MSRHITVRELLRFLHQVPESLLVNLTIELDDKQYAAPLSGLTLKKRYRKEAVDGEEVSVELFHMKD